MSHLSTIDRYEPTPADLADYGRWLAATDAEFHSQDEPTPLDLLADGTDYDGWPDWAQTERWGLPMTDLDLGAEYRSPDPSGDTYSDAIRAALRGLRTDDVLIDRLQGRDGYPA